MLKSPDIIMFKFDIVGIFKTDGNTVLTHWGRVTHIYASVN